MDFKQIRNEIKTNYDNIVGIVAYKNNKKCYEDYFDGFKSDNAMHIYLVIKSIVSMLIGIAIDKVYIKREEEKNIDYIFKHRFGKNQEVLNSLTIKDFLTLIVPYKTRYKPYTKVFKVTIGFHPL